MNREASVCVAVEATMKSHFALALALFAFVPAAALAQSQNEQQACMSDAFSVCGHAIPDRDRVAACLAKNVSRLSPGCRMVMARYPKPGTQARRDRGYDQGDRYDRDPYERSSRFDRYEQRGERWGRY